MTDDMVFDHYRDGGVSKITMLKTGNVDKEKTATGEVKYVGQREHNWQVESSEQNVGTMSRNWRRRVMNWRTPRMESRNGIVACVCSVLTFSFVLWDWEASYIWK